MLITEFQTEGGLTSGISTQMTLNNFTGSPRISAIILNTHFKFTIYKAHGTLSPRNTFLLATWTFTFIALDNLLSACAQQAGFPTSACART
jgi:hypothetical protein